MIGRRGNGAAWCGESAAWRGKSAVNATPEPESPAAWTPEAKLAAFMAHERTTLELWPSAPCVKRRRSPARAAMARCRERLNRLPRCARALSGPAARDLLRALATGSAPVARAICRTLARAPDVITERVVSHNHRWIWICVPKAGSRSLFAALLAADPNAEVVRDWRQYAADRPELRDYFRFAFVRDPLARTLSFHAELHRREPSPRTRLCRQFHGLAATRRFADYCRWLNTPYGSDEFADRHFASQRLILRSGDRPPDFVGRTERLEADFRRAMRATGTPASTVPLLHTMIGWRGNPATVRAAHAAERGRVTATDRALLAKRYAGDFDLATP